MSMNSFSQAQKEWRKAANPMSMFEAQTRRNMAMFEQAMKMFMPGVAPGSTGPAEPRNASQPPSNPFIEYQAEALAAMQEQMEAIQKQLADLSRKE